MKGHYIIVLWFCREKPCGAAIAGTTFKCIIPNTPEVVSKCLIKIHLQIRSVELL